MLFINKLFNSIAYLLSFTNLQLVIPERTWILLYLGRTVYKCLWACLALYTNHNKQAQINNRITQNPPGMRKPSDEYDELYQSLISSTLNYCDN